MICVCAQIRKDGHMEENAQKFLEKMNELVALGKKKKSILDVQEINDFFADMELSAEQMEKRVFDNPVGAYRNVLNSFIQGYLTVSEKEIQEVLDDTKI